MVIEQKSLTPQRKEFFAPKRFKPRLVSIIQKYRTDRKEGKPTSLKKDTGVWLLQVGTALAINRATARLIGVGSWDPKLEGSAERMIKDASPVSMSISTAIASMIPAHYADPIMAAEFVVCAIRIWTEQKAWEKVGVTGDPAGPILSPFTAGVLEFAYKATEKHPQNESTRLLVAVNGLFGNVVRMAEAGLLVLGHYLYNKYKQPPEQN